jgi:hypothetical protein
MRRVHLSMTFCLAILWLGGCGAVDSDPPAAIEQKAREMIPLQTQTISTAPPDSSRIERMRPPVVPTSPQIPRRQQRALPETAADALARIGEPAVPSVIVMLSDPNPELRVRAANILAQIGDQASPAVPELIARLRDEDETVRKAAAHALGQMGPSAADAVPALLRAASDTTP